VKLILASSSPRRAQILRDAGFDFTIKPANVDESLAPGEAVEAYVARIAQAKAHAVAGRALADGTPAIVIAADTVVLAGKQILPKPKDADDARRMLRSLAGRSHWVYTGFCLVLDSRSISDSVATEVVMDDLSNAEIDEYVESGEPLDKAGAYAIQGLASKFVREIRGCYQNVVGLPVSRIYRLLRALPQS